MNNDHPAASPLLGTSGSKSSGSEEARLLGLDCSRWLVYLVAAKNC